MSRRVGRSGGEPAITPLRHNLYLEGESQAPGVGTFRGFAHAMKVREGEDGAEAPDRSYLVLDPTKPEPVWVRANEITMMSGGPTSEPPSADRSRSADQS